MHRKRDAKFGPLGGPTNFTGGPTRCAGGPISHTREKEKTGIHISLQKGQISPTCGEYIETQRAYCRPLWVPLYIPPTNTQYTPISPYTPILWHGPPCDRWGRGTTTEVGPSDGLSRSGVMLILYYAMVVVAVGGTVVLGLLRD